MIKKIFISVLVLFVGFSVLALDVGTRAPALKVSVWLKNGPVSLYPDEDSDSPTPGYTKGDYYVIFFFATWSDLTPNVFKFVNDQVTAYRDAGVKFIGITTENEARVRDYIKKFPDIKFHLAVDDHNKTWNDYMNDGAGLPVFFIFDKNEKLVWSGSPVEEDQVLQNVLIGTFDSATESKLEELHKKMARAAEVFDFSGRKNLALEALKVDPTDRIAIEVKVDDYLKNNKVDDCFDFLKDCQKKAGDNKYLQYFLYMTELDIARGLVNKDGKADVLDIAKNYMETFQNSPDYLNSMAARLSEGVPIEVTSMKYSLEMAEKAVAIQRASDPKSPYMGKYLQTLAHVYYLVGKLDKAIEIQKEAIPLFEKVDRELAQLRLAYYQDLLSINILNSQPNNKENKNGSK